MKALIMIHHSETNRYKDQVVLFIVESTVWNFLFFFGVALLFELGQTQKTQEKETFSHLQHREDHAPSKTSHSHPNSVRGMRVAQ